MDWGFGRLTRGFAIGPSVWGILGQKQTRHKEGSLSGFRARYSGPKNRGAIYLATSGSVRENIPVTLGGGNRDARNAIVRVRLRRSPIIPAHQGGFPLKRGGRPYKAQDNMHAPHKHRTGH